MQLIVPDKAPKTDIVKKSLYLQLAYAMQRNVVVARAAPDLARSVKQDIWQDVIPLKSGFEVELVFELPCFLPKLNDEDEYFIKVKKQPFLINNRHCQVILDGMPNHYILCHYLTLPNIERTFGKSINQWIKMKTMISTKYKIQDKSASQAVENNIVDLVTEASNGISKISNSIRYFAAPQKVTIPDLNNIERQSIIYVFCRGRKKIVGALPFMFHYNAYPLQSFDSLKYNEKVLNDISSDKKTLRSHKALFQKSMHLYESGEFGLSCILACTACEIALSELLKSNVQKRGLSNNKIKDALNDLHFSQLVNLISYYLLDMKSLSNKKMMGSINSMRKLRNRIVHDGTWVTNDDRNIIKNGLDSINTLINSNTLLKKN